MKTKQTKRGISLIVLVITIIVMIILAAAIVITLSNSGIIGKANEAVNLTNMKQINQIAQVIWAEGFTDELRGEELEKYVKDKLAEQGITDAKYNITVTDKGVEITSKGDVLLPYFGKAYNCQLDDGKIISVIFYEDGSIDYFENGVSLWGKSPVGFVVYEDGTISGADENIPANLSSNRTKLTTTDGQIFVLGELPQPPQEPIEYVDFVINQSNRGDIGYTDSTTNLVIPETFQKDGVWYKVVGIESARYNSEGAFYGCANLTSVTFPSTITYIGDYAFDSCTGLTGKLVIPDSIVTIGKRSFYNCTGLNKLTLGNSVQIIGDSAFGSCTGLTGELVIPNSVEKIGTTCTLGKGGASSSTGAFGSCSGISSITWGSGVKIIGDFAFARCTGITGELIIPDSVTDIGRDAFSQDTNITKLIIGNSVQNIGGNAFDYCTGITGELIIPDSVINIGIAGISSYQTGAFNDCAGLTNVTIGESLKVLGEKTFRGCSNLTKVTFNNKGELTNINPYVFKECTNLKQIHIVDIAAWCKIDFYNSNAALLENRDLYLGETKVTDLVIPASVNIINDYAFYNCSSITSVTFENPNGWYVTKTNGTEEQLTLTDSTINASYLKNTYGNLEWKKAN